jgi:peptidoglycan hydrolase-like protein with peptidoglycan-binding domain
MTFPTAARVIATAVSQAGTTEDPPGSNHTKYNAAFGDYSQGWAWCGIFVWWAFKQAGVDLRKDASIANPQFTPWFWSEAKKAGWVVEADENIRPGDVLFFDFEPPFNTAGIQHVGIATARPAHGYVSTIEGNTSSGNRGSQDNGGGVFARVRDLGWIVAAVRPPYSRPPIKLTVHGPLAKGDIGPSVRLVQHRLRIGEDGVFGPLTERAVCRFQAAKHLDVDGIVGPRTAAALGFFYRTSK